MNCRLLHAAIAVAMLAFLQGCRSCSDSGLDDRVSRLVWMKYVHVANVGELDAPYSTGTVRLAPVNRDGFWAVFDICTLDVQGSALGGFNYNAASFHVDTGSVQYGTMNPGMVNTGLGGGAKSGLDPQVRALVHDALKLSPATQYFPKQFYPNLRYRIAVFVNDTPPGYRGEPLPLRYSGHPTMVQDQSPGNPEFRGFFQYSASPAIAGTCP